MLMRFCSKSRLWNLKYQSLQYKHGRKDSCTKNPRVEKSGGFTLTGGIPPPGGKDRLGSGPRASRVSPCGLSACPRRPPGTHPDESIFPRVLTFDSDSSEIKTYNRGPGFLRTSGSMAKVPRRPAPRACPAQPTPRRSAAPPQAPGRAAAGDEC